MYRQPQKCKFIQDCWRRERKLWWCPLASCLDGERTSRRRISILRWHSDKFELDSNSSALYGKVQGKRSQFDNTMPTIVSNLTFITFFDIQQIWQMYYSATRGDLYAYIGFLDLRTPKHGSPVIRQVSLNIRNAFSKNRIPGSLTTLSLAIQLTLAVALFMTFHF